MITHRRSPTLAELLNPAAGVTFEERKSCGCLLERGSLNEYRSQSRAGRRPMTRSDLRVRLAYLEDRLRLEPGELTG